MLNLYVALDLHAKLLNMYTVYTVVKVPLKQTGIKYLQGRR
jgi:hypothetical protein